jgi:hypothetical protein
MAIRDTTCTSLLYLLVGLVGAITWCLILFTGASSLSQARDTLMYLLRDAAEREFFRWLLATPIACLALATLYASPLARNFQLLVVLAILGATLAALTWVHKSASVPLVTLASAYGCYAVYRTQRGAMAPNKSLERSRDR